MQTLDTLKTRSQETVTNLIDRGKEQPDDVKALGVTAAAGVAGALVVTAATKGLLAVVGLLASPPIALTAGALGGGALGWTYMQRQSQSGAGDAAASTGDSVANMASTEAVASPPDTAAAADKPTTDAKAEAPSE